MAWFAANWFWVLILIAFIAMHMFGHGGHGVMVVMVEVIVNEAGMIEKKTKRKVAS